MSTEEETHQGERAIDIDIREQYSRLLQSATCLKARSMDFHGRFTGGQIGREARGDQRESATRPAISKRA